MFFILSNMCVRHNSSHLRIASPRIVLHYTIRERRRQKVFYVDYTCKFYWPIVPYYPYPTKRGTTGKREDSGSNKERDGARGHTRYQGEPSCAFDMSIRLLQWFSSLRVTEVVWPIPPFSPYREPSKSSIKVTNFSYLLKNSRTCLLQLTVIGDALLDKGPARNFIWKFAFPDFIST